MTNSKTTSSTSHGRSWRGSTLTCAGMLLMLCGCEHAPKGHHHHHHHAQAAPASVIVVGPGNDSKKTEELTTDAVVGGIVDIELPGNAGTGYTWSMTAHSEDVELVGSPTTEPLEAGLPGGPTVTNFKLRMKSAGRQTARLELAHPWEADTPAARVVHLVISVTGARTDAP